MTITVLLMKEGKTWVAVCLEYFLASQGEGPIEAFDSFLMVLGAQIELDKAKGRVWYEGFEEAPDDYWEKAKKDGPARSLWFPCTLVNPDLAGIDFRVVYENI